MRKKLLWTGVTLLLLVAAAGFAWVAWRRNTEAKAREEAQRKQAQQAVVLKSDIIAGGMIGAKETVAVPTPIEGIVKAFHAEVGAEVYEGQLLAEIQSEGLEAAQQQSTLELERAQTRVSNLESTITAARLEASRASADSLRVRSEFERASRTYSRQKLLMAEGATPRNAFAKAEQEFKQLESESKELARVSENADERVSTLTRDLDAARKVLEGRVADMESAKTRVDAGQVISPVSGVVASRKGEAGGEVHPTMEDLFLIAADTSTLVVTMELPPNDIARVKAGAAASVSVADVPSEMLQGQVTAVQDGRVTVEFANPSPLVKPGQTAQVRIAVP